MKTSSINNQKLITVKKISQNDSSSKPNNHPGILRSHTPEIDNTSHKRSQSMTEVTPNDIANYKEWNVSEKIKKEMEKKYSFLSNKVNALRKKEKQVETKMSAMHKKSQQIEEIKRKKNEFKKELQESKEQKLKRLNEQKQKVKNIRLYEHNKQLTLQEMANQKQRLILEINKADQNLMRTMLSQTQSKTEANNRLKYLKEKEHQENNKKLAKLNKDNQIKNRQYKNKIYLDNNLNTTQNLKFKCNQLEKLESQYRTEIQFNQLKVGEINHPVNYYKNLRLQTDISTSNGSRAPTHISPINLQDEFMKNQYKTISTNQDEQRARITKTPIPQTRKPFRP